MRSIPNDLAMSLFAENRLRDERLKKLLVKRLLKTKNNINCKTIVRISNIVRISKPVVTSQSHPIRDIVILKPWHLPSNLYNVKDIKVNPEGYKGAYISQLERTSDTIIYHNRPSKELGEFKFYDKPDFSAKMNSKCSKFNGVFGSGPNPRDRPPSSRNMITNNTFSYRSPRIGPATYFPTDNLLQTSRPKQTQKEIPYKFYHNSIVPIKKNEIHKHCTEVGPDPTYYHPNNSKENYRKGVFDPDIHNKIELNKIAKYRHLPYNRKIVRLQLKTTTDDNYKIKGNGYRSLFRRSSFDNYKRVSLSQTKDVLDLTHLAYLQMIKNPKRDRSPYYNKNIITLPKKIYFSATGKIKSHKKAENTKLAFSSTQPRWPNGEYKPVTIQSYEQKKKDTDEHEKIKSKKPKKIVNSRYLDDFNILDPNRKSVTFNFGNLFQKTPEKQLITLDYWDKEYHFNTLHKYFLKEPSHEEFYKVPKVTQFAM